MQKRKSYDTAQAYTTREQLPVGGYVLKILDVQDVQYDWGEQLVFSFDITEGEQKNFFTHDYNSQTQEDKKWRGTYRLRVPEDDDPEEDDWKMRRFKTVMLAFEDSNPGYHWDWNEKGLKGKLIGGLFNNKEYEIEGRHGFFTNCHSLVSVEKIRSGDFKIPDDTLLKNSKQSSLSSGSTAPADAGWINIPESDEETVPFD